MTLYRLTWTARPTPYHHPREFKTWHGTQDDARRAAKDVPDGAVTNVSVPTDKAGLLIFLNAEFQPQRVEK